MLMDWFAPIWCCTCRFHSDTMGVMLLGSNPTTLTPVGAAKLNCPGPVPRVKLPDGKGPVAFVEISCAGVQFGSQGREPVSVMRKPCAYVCVCTPAKGGFCANWLLIPPRSIKKNRPYPPPTTA